MALGACTNLPTRAVSALPDDLIRFEPVIQPRGVARPNADIAEDFLDLTFALEGGDTIPRLLKFRGPVRVAFRSAGFDRWSIENLALCSAVIHLIVEIFICWRNIYIGSVS